MAAQQVIRLYKRCLVALPTPQGLKHKQEVIEKAQQLALTYAEDTSVLERAAVSRLHDQIGPAITAGIPKETKTNRAGFAEWVDRILDQRG
eukprot:9517753-Karenia_brevis.AAC.1